MNSKKGLTISENSADKGVLAETQLKQELAREALRWQSVLSTPDGRAFFMDVLRFLGFKQTSFDLNDKKMVALSVTKDAADSLFSRAMTHCRHEAVQMIEENF